MSDIEHAIEPEALHLGDDLVVPVDAALGRFVILGKSGAGKTNADCVLIEEFVRAKVPTVILDPLGNMHGLRSSADGESEGLSIAVFGGQHGDLPLPLDRAEYVADQLAEGISAVLDMLEMSLDEQVEFAKRFLPRLLQRAQTSMHVAVEEADRFAPNKVGVNPVVMWARTCRNAGQGWTFSTQKGQILHHDVVDSASVFVAMKMTGELAQEAIGGEIGSRIGKKSAARMIADLPHFKRGEAWFVPDADWLGVDAAEWEPRRTRFRLRDTFEIRPPRIGQTRREQRVLAPVDIARLRLLFASDDDSDPDAIEKVSDVDAPRARIADLEAALDKGKGATPAADAAEIADLRAERDAALERSARATAAKDQLLAALEDIRQTAADAIDRAQHGPEALGVCGPAPSAAPAPAELVPRQRPRVEVKERAVPDPGKTDAVVNDTDLSGGALKVLRVVAMLGGRARRTDLGIAAGYSPKAGGFRNLLSELRGAGHITDEDSQHVALTPMGAAIAGDWCDRRLVNHEIHDMWRAKLDGGPRKLFDVLIEAYPNHLSREALAARAGYVASAGGFRNNLSALRRTELIKEIGKDIWASSALFPAGKSR